MSFASGEFALFLCAAVLLYYLMPKRVRWTALLLFSYVFYLWGGVYVLGYILFTTLTTYLFGYLIGNVSARDGTRKEKSRALKRKKLFAALCRCINLFKMQRYL